MKQSVVILGGGISGLATAWFLKKQYQDSVNITIVEKAPRLGGWIRTIRQEGFLFELGPRSCRASGSGLATLRLVEELGLQDQVVTASPDARRRYLYSGGRLQPLPTNPFSCLLSPLMRPLLWPLLREWSIAPSQAADESVYEFVERRLGHHAAAFFVDSLVSGIYAGDPKKLSMKSCFPALYRWEQEHGSLTKGLFKSRRPKEALSPFIHHVQKEGLFSFRQGMQQLVDTLASRLEVDIRTGCEVLSLIPQHSGMIVTTSSGTLQADHVISALPAHCLASLVAANDPALANLLQGIHATSVAVVNVGYRRRVLQREGFGYLIPSQEKEKILGVVWDSSAFPQHNSSKEETRLTGMVGGDLMPNFDDHRAEEWQAVVLEALEKHLGITAQPDTLVVTLARRAIPQYTIGHADRLQAIAAHQFPHLEVTGNSFGGVSVNDSIETSSMRLKNLVKMSVS